MNSCIPELPVTDIHAALIALEGLGFRRAWVFENDFASVYGDANVEIYLRLEEPPIQPVTLYLNVDDADGLYADYQRHAELVAPIRSTPWGMRESSVRTIDGHVFRVGHEEQGVAEIDAFSRPDPDAAQSGE